MSDSDKPAKKALPASIVLILVTALFAAIYYWGPDLSKNRAPVVSAFDAATSISTHTVNRDGKDIVFTYYPQKGVATTEWSRFQKQAEPNFHLVYYAKGIMGQRLCREVRNDLRSLGLDCLSYKQLDLADSILVSTLVVSINAKHGEGTVHLPD